MDQINQEQATPVSTNIETNKKFDFAKNKMLLVTAFIILLLIAVWIWKAVEISNLKKENEKKEALLKQRADELINQSEINYLKLLAKPYVWAIRTEIMKGNIEAVNLYSNDMVKEKNFQVIMVVNEKGIIVSSTDKKLEGKHYLTIGKEAYLKTDSTIAEKISGETVVVSSPVMGFNKRIGTLIFTHTSLKTEW